jgi:hypothetical protein
MSKKRRKSNNYAGKFANVISRDKLTNDMVTLTDSRVYIQKSVTKQDGTKEEYYSTVIRKQPNEDWVYNVSSPIQMHGKKFIPFYYEAINVLFRSTNEVKVYVRILGELKKLLLYDILKHGLFIFNKKSHRRPLTIYYPVP